MTRSSVAKLEQDAGLAGVAAAGALSFAEVGTVGLVGLLVCPPLAILTVVVAVPVLVTALAVGLLAAVLATPYLIVQHFRGGDHLSVLRRRLRRAGRALIDLAPHRIHAEARGLNAAR